MYLEHFGLRRKPFTLLPDPGFLLLTRQHDMGLRLLEYGLASAAMISVLTGEVGSGKTTLVRCLLDRTEDNVAVGLVNVTPDHSASLLQWVAAALDLTLGATDPVAAQRAITDFIVAQYARGRRVLLVIDEAQNLGMQRLEELRLLTNLNVDQHLVLQMLLVGQPELREMLRQPVLRQFLQRVSIDYHLGPLDPAETRAYVRHRLEVAGGTGDLIEEAAIDLCHVASGGVPRIINLLCDLALLYAYAETGRHVAAATMQFVIRDRVRGGLFPGVSATSPPVAGCG